MEMNWTEVKELLDLSLKDLTSKDGKLLYLGANERSITHRLAYHLEKHLRQKYNVEKLSVDCEYNRETNSPATAKRIRDITQSLLEEDPKISFDDTTGRTVFPDIIIHERGEPKNMLVIEAKKGNRPSDADILKLIAFTDPRGEFQYRFGVFLGITFEESSKKTTATILQFVKGRTTGDSFTAEYQTNF